MAGVEFLPEEYDADAAEVLDAVPARRFGPVVRVLAVVATLAAVIAWIVTRPGDNHRSVPAAIATSSPARHTPVPNTVICTMGAPVPDEITNSMRRFVPGIVIDNLSANRCVRTVAGARRVVSESVGGTLGRLDIQVTLGSRTAGLPPDWQVVRPGEQKILLGSVETESAGVKVRVSVRGTAKARGQFYDLQRLADYLSLNTVL